MDQSPPKDYHIDQTWIPPTPKMFIKDGNTAMIDHSANQVSTTTTTIADSSKMTIYSPPSPNGKQYVRPRGVFPEGVQPQHIVLVVDDAVPYLDTPALKRRGYDILPSTNLDMIGFINLILSDKFHKQDGALFVVIPWFSFFLKHLHVFVMSQNEDEVAKLNPMDTEDRQDLRIQNTSTLLNIVKDFSSQLSTHDVSILNGDLEQNLIRSPIERNKGQVEQLYGGRMLAQRLIHSACSLRSVIRQNTTNSDVVFCGFPLHLMDGQGAARLFTKQVWQYSSCHGQLLQFFIFCAIW